MTDLLVPPVADTKECAACGETIRAAARKCRFCGEDFEALEAADERVFFEGRPALLCSLGQYAVALLTLGLALIYYQVKRLGVHYRITSQRIQIDKGILSKVRNNVELYRIDDYDLRRPLGMRLVGNAELALRSSDREQAEVVLAGLPDLGFLAELIREYGLQERERRSIQAWAQA